MAIFESTEVRDRCLCSFTILHHHPWGIRWVWIALSAAGDLRTKSIYASVTNLKRLVSCLHFIATANAKPYHLLSLVTCRWWIR